MFRFSIIALLALAAAILSPADAGAHAHLKRAKPAAGSTVTPSPTEVVVTFTEKLEAKFSSIEVQNGQGAPMQTGATTLSDNATELRTALKPLPPGTYKVIWRVLAVDTHRAQGSFTFKVGP